MFNCFITLFFIIFMSCAYQDPYFESYQKMVKDYCIEYNGNNCNRIYYISIRFANEIIEDNENKIGYCYSLDGIYIKQYNWYKISEEEREILILHEYGHCAFDKDHTENKDSIMYPKTNEVLPYYKEYKQELLQEYFSED